MSCPITFHFHNYERSIVTLAPSPISRTVTRRGLRNHRSFQHPRGEVTIMIRKLQDVLIFNSRPVRKDKTRFNAQLLEQRREDIFLAMHQMGLLR